MKFFIPFLLLNFIVVFSHAQSDTLKTTSNNSIKIQKPNPILFVEGSVGRSRGWAVGGSINYQLDHHFFTFRYNYLIKLNTERNPIFLSIFPIVKTAREENELGILYGYRFINDEYSVSFSLGVSYNFVDYYDRDTEIQIDRQRYAGLPFEINIKGFNAIKKRYRIYGLIPVTKPTAFANSLGLKLIGNISKRSYIGLGISYGFGYHKVYK